MHTPNNRTGSDRSYSSSSRPFKKYNSKPSSGGYASRGNSSYGRSSSREGSSFGGNRRSGSAHRNSNRSGGRGRGTTFNPAQFINTNPVQLAPDVYEAKHRFDTFGLHDALAKTIASIGLVTPSPIQDQIIPEILNGHDVIGLAETGTGKTAAFLIPLIHKTMSDENRSTLILTPTRELASQIEVEFKKLSKHTTLTSTVIVGGVRVYPQIKSLHRKNHFIIGTPGRVLDLINQGALKTAGITTIVLDEADRMLDMGFIHDIKKILATLPTKRETLFFSATMSPDIHAIVHTFMQNPVTISVKKKDVTNSIEQNIVEFEEATKLDTLTTLFDDETFSRIIIFCDMKHSTEKLSRDLVRCGIKAVSIHGNKNQGQRQRALDAFKRGDARVMVATDVAARGIHVDDVSHVINYDLPKTFHDYVHRIGRTGRGTKNGKALTFVPKRGGFSAHASASTRDNGSSFGSSRSSSSYSSSYSAPRASYSSRDGRLPYKSRNTKPAYTPRGDGRSSSYESRSSYGTRSDRNNTYVPRASYGSRNDTHPSHTSRSDSRESYSSRNSRPSYQSSDTTRTDRPYGARSAKPAHKRRDTDHSSRASSHEHAAYTPRDTSVPRIIRKSRAGGKSRKEYSKPR